MDLGQGIRKALARITGATLVDEAAVKDLLKDLQRVLITNDVNVRLVSELSKRIEERALKEKQGKGYSLREHITLVVYEELCKIMGDKYEPVVGKQRIMLCGLFGQGKTTTAGKLAKFYAAKGLRVGLIGADIHRPAAFEQLQQLSKQAGVAYFGDKKLSALENAKEGSKHFAEYDVVILDSAGRSAFDEELARELKNVYDEFKPTEKFLVVSADLGQVAGKQAEQFHSVLGLTGVIVTRIDGSGKGGGALSSVAKTGTKIAFLGSGEKMDALEVFDAKKFVARLVGFADLEGLLDKVREVADQERMEKVMSGEEELNYDSFISQLKAMRKMGPLKQIMQMLGAYDLPEEVIGQSEKKLAQYEAIVNSMTPKERIQTDLMKQKTRQERIARGAGMKPDEVRDLVNNFERMHKMMKGMKRNRGLMKQLGKMGGAFPGLK